MVTKNPRVVGHISPENHKPYSHRRFLQNAALFSTGLVTSLAYAGKAIPINPSAPVEYIVVGSGAGPSFLEGKIAAGAIALRS